ncbi:ThiF family adenylyltransferase [Chryseoglobus sp. 28M-23]|uniref:ThiF family adenylyltransferase n=1 Tax=Chryseoglobus sp. 28M-23 TaxID=2772253 RepID=UPI0017461278|nr:ThiF family adenylyltransferase [Chryseoglobus sp. 28M-23]QOD94315.1 ThiF family adenylyltransferase [Chryseoglobus sp. 28M-23]
MPDASRHARQLALPGFGTAAQDALARARVLVIGAGGLGSVLLPQLVGAGLATGPGGRLGIVDDDVVELSNLHRQHLHGTADVGRPKVDSAAERLRALDPAVTVMTHRQRFTSENALELLADYDLLVDGSDGFATRYLAADAATLRGIPLVWGAVLQYGGQTGVCPVGGPGYRDLFPAPPAPDAVLDCATGGVLPSVCGVIGAIMAGQVVTLLTGVGDALIGRVTTYDARTGRFRELPFGHDPQAAPVTELIDYEQFCGTAPAPAATGDSGRSLEVSARELAQLLETVFADGTERDARPLLLDVREPWEHELTALPGSALVPLGQLPAAIGALPRDRETIVYCHHGIRSQDALRQLLAAGIPARHLAGGIDAWSRDVDPAVARY